jgi:hypothetical protein
MAANASANHRAMNSFSVIDIGTVRIGLTQMQGDNHH